MPVYSLGLIIQKVLISLGDSSGNSLNSPLLRGGPTLVVGFVFRFFFKDVESNIDTLSENSLHQKIVIREFTLVVG